ncbi:mechanosensitive ion channel protein MscS [Pontibacillus litoralis JSM 072002]|uniref:Mechanosensitive ion channel protein MscS n=2 Tax=Pontibacillus TaxID=289201 RepID=A0A0A5FXZ3_9BACI|nr:mechanosensitive ion channel protein MscS [Pontibacillus litoralis JSM 072002]
MKEVKTDWEAFYNMLTGPDLWVDIALKIGTILFILFMAMLVIRIGKKIIQNLFKKRRRGPFQITERRENTLIKLLENTLTYTIYFAAIVMILQNLGFEVGAMLAGAGIAGLAIGFGAQSLVQDIISGFFIIFEDQFSVGDYIQTNTSEGFVEEIGFRTTKIKHWTGKIYIIPNGNIKEVTNYSIHNSIAVVDVSIAYEGDINRAEEAIEELLQEMPNRYEEIRAVPELLGVQHLGTSDIQLRIIAETEPMMHWHIARMMRKDIKNHLDERGIEIPFPRLVLYSRTDEAQSIEGGEDNG